MNKLPIRWTHVICTFSIRFAYFQREKLSLIVIRFQRMPAYWIYFSFVSVSWLKPYSVTGPFNTNIIL